MDGPGNEKAPRARGAATPTELQSAWLDKKQPDATHALRIAHVQDHRGRGPGPGRPPRQGRAPGRHRPAPRIARSRDDRKKHYSPERAIGRPILLVTNAPLKEQRGAFLADELGRGYAFRPCHPGAITARQRLLAASPQRQGLLAVDLGYSAGQGAHGHLGPRTWAQAWPLPRTGGMSGKATTRYS